jgi:hypothetical protein
MFSLALHTSGFEDKTNVYVLHVGVCSCCYTRIPLGDYIFGYPGLIHKVTSRM